MSLSLICSLLASSALIGFSFVMLASPWTTPEPSLINCFNYLEPIEGRLLYFGAILLGLAQMVAHALKSRFTADVSVSALVLIGAYVILVSIRSNVAVYQSIEVGSCIGFFVLTSALIYAEVRKGNLK